jgi:signal transduction histidine kinase
MHHMRTGHFPTDSAAHHGRWWTSTTLALAATALTGVLWMVGWLPAVDRVSGDLLLRTSPRRTTPAAPVAAVLIDDTAVARFGPLPWPRDRLARVVAAVEAAGARATAVDLILAEPGTPDGDSALARALKATPVALAAAIDNDGTWLLPLDDFGGLEAAAHAYGEVGPDGVVRSIAATKQAGDLSLPALSLAAARMLRPDLATAPGTDIRPEFRPAPQDVTAFSAATALAGELPADEISGRLVFLGISATGAGDQFVVPTGPGHAPVAGVLAHASAAASILEGRLLHRFAPTWSLAAAFVLAFGVQLLRDRRGAFDLSRFTLLIAGVCVVAVLSLWGGLVLVPVAALLTAMVISALLREAMESRLAHRETGRLLQAILAHSDPTPPRPVPRTASARLEAIKTVQRRVFREDATRRALLAGMTEGVVLWGPGGDVLEANPAAERLWGHVPAKNEILGGGGQVDGGESLHQRGSRELSVIVTGLDANHLAIIRDVTAERTLERRRRDMQRLVSHELKTPLASIAGFGETLERYRLSGDELSRVASMIRGEALRLQDMVTVFLDLERLGAGHWDGEAGPIDIAALVTARLEILEAAARARGLSITSELADSGRITGVPALIDRVVDNLVGNAIKYSPPGDPIEVEVRRDEERAILTVRDHGPGIPKESLGRIFDRFYRVPGSGGAGAGLGLALVKEVVDWHGGCMTIDSEPGVGSTFSVSLPVAQED